MTPTNSVLLSKTKGHNMDVMKKISLEVAILLLVLIPCCLLSQSPSGISQAAGSIPFKYIVIDDQEWGIRSIGDVDGDGFADIVAKTQGDGKDPSLTWYEYPDWNKHTITAPDNYRSDDIELADIDSDGDLDIVAVVDEPGKVYWYENPRPGGNPADIWPSKHYIGLTNDGPDPDSYVKDLEVDDFTRDGQPDVVARTHRKVFVFRQDSPTSWTAIRTISIHDHEGMDVADLDGDEDPDIALNGFWLETPDDPVNDTWLEHNIDGKWWTQSDSGWMDNNSKVYAADLNQDHRTDVLICHSEKPDYPVSWYEAADPKTGPWTEHIIVDHLDYCHTLQAADMNNDGILDVVAAEMPKSSDPDEVNVFVNSGDSLTWTKQVVATTGNYSAQVGDIGNDGDMDIVGCRSYETAPLELWENQVNDPLDNWAYIQVDDSRAKWGDFDSPDWLRYFGLAMGDLTGDGYGDIVSGRYFYRNPRGDLTNTWPRVDLGFNVDAMLIVDVDEDNLGDAIGEALPDVYWLEAVDAQGTSWHAIKIGTIPKTNHTNSQGYTTAQIIPGGNPEILLGGGDGIYYFEIPANPSAGNWPRTRAANGASDTAVGVGDIDGDGEIDIAGIDPSGGDKVAWWKNPGDGSADWQKYKIGTTDGDWPDRVAIADLDRDDRPDIVVTEEEQPVNPDYKTYWFEQPANPKSTGWDRHTIATQYTTNSMDVADMDQDGDIDIITGEHRGTEKVVIWENVDNRSSWLEHVVSQGKESHLGARVADLDADGDLEIVSIAWDDYQFLHLWRNDATPGGGWRVTDGLQVLYAFDEGSGTTVHDVSGVGAPLDLTVEDDEAISWLASSGLAINASTIVASAGAATKIVDAVKSSNELTIEAWLRPANGTQDGPARIVTLSDGAYLRNFTLGQASSSYETRLRTTATSNNGIPSLTAGTVYTRELSHVVYTRDQSGVARFHVNGVQTGSQNDITGDFSNWDEGFRFGLANEFGADRSWLGEFHLVAIFSRALSQAEVSRNYDAGPAAVSPRIWLPLVLKSYIARAERGER